jgi:hypothetical protein
MASDDKENRRRNDLVDQSKLLNKRAKRAIASSQERLARGRHQWVYFNLGRMCQRCELLQPKDEFDDEVPCSA